MIMIRSFLLSIFLLLQVQLAFSQATTTYPQGEIKGPFSWKSTIYPGTERNYWIHVPAQYNASKPACVMVVQDGLSRANGWNLPNVMDSLIALKAVPVTIGIFIDHGKVSAATDDAYPRFNRSLEYDAMGDRYARFLLEEILPEVSRSYNLSSNPNDRSIAGASSGAICAFNVAWERPSEFRRVLSTIGTYVGLRGGDTFATLVRKSEPKPLRIFLEDGDHDLNIYGGDWWMANQDMLSALTWAGYEVTHEWGTEGHNSKHAKMILADALVWLWKGYPEPVTAHKSKNKLMKLVKENESWKAIATSDVKVDKLAVDKNGELYFSASQSVFRMQENGSPLEIAKLDWLAGGMSFAQDGNLFIGDLSHHKIVAINKQGILSDLVENVSANFMAISQKGIYFSETSNNRIGFYSFANKSVLYTSVPGNPTGLCLSAEQTFLNVGFANHVMGYSYQIGEEGILKFGQEYIHFQIPYGAKFANAGGMAVDAKNILYSSTSMGIQASDQLGRVNFIFEKPEGNVLDIKFGGADFDTLYMNCSGKLFARKIKAKGVLSWQPAVKPTKPHM